jgi:hypothetical protein
MGLITERILPIPKIFRETLINMYCPASFEPVQAPTSLTVTVLLGSISSVGEQSTIHQPQTLLAKL